LDLPLLPTLRQTRPIATQTFSGTAKNANNVCQVAFAHPSGAATAALPDIFSMQQLKLAKAALMEVNKVSQNAVMK